MLQSPITEISIFSSPYITEWEWRRKKKNLYLLLLWQAFLQALLSYHAWEITWASSQKKTVFGGLGTTKLQTSLRICAVWSAPLLFAFWKAPYLSLLQAKSLFSVHPTSPSGSEEGRKKIYPCCFCGKHFSRPSFLTMHERLHYGEKPYKCSTCDKSFSRPSALATHQRIHTVEFPHKCDVCGMRFTDVESLMSHQTIHMYKCSTCDKSFRLHGNLDRHMRIHDIEKPYKCDVCGERFTVVESLLSHQTTHKKKLFIPVVQIHF